jgi:hypothetical protein
MFVGSLLDADGSSTGGKRKWQEKIRGKNKASG